MTTTAAIGLSPRRDPSNRAYHDAPHQNMEVIRRGLAISGIGSSLLPLLLYSTVDASSQPNSSGYFRTTTHVDPYSNARSDYHRHGHPN